MDSGQSIGFGRLIASSRDPAGWRAGELGQILRHQLAASLETDLGSAVIELAADVPEKTAWCVTFRDLFQHQRPSLAMLQRVKAFAKNCRANPNGPLPPEVALVLYYASILAALLRHDQKITDLTTDSLLEGVGWALDRSWLDEALRKLFEEGRSRLKAGQ